jgi:hypothetical protein
MPGPDRWNGSLPARARLVSSRDCREKPLGTAGAILYTSYVLLLPDPLQPLHRPSHELSKLVFH